MYQETLERIVATIVDELGIDEKEISENSRISSDLDVNSLELLNVVMAIEEDFGITFDENKLRKIKTVGDIANYVEEIKS
ncbi:MAG: acyl carrier protein [Ruminococcaceae bacterium]|nr:acyl carrier protein [Oscillospiraceae bacterium]